MRNVIITNLGYECVTYGESLQATHLLNLTSTTTIMPVATGLSSIEGLPSFTLVINRGRFLHLSVGRTFFLNSFFNLHTYFFRAQRTVAPEIVAPNPVAANPPNQVVRAAIFTSRDVGMKIRVIFIFIWGIHFFESRFCSENSLKSKKYLEHSSFRYLASRSGYFKKMAN